jgi:hypothetical protein
VSRIEAETIDGDGFCIAEACGEGQPEAIHAHPLVSIEIQKETRNLSLNYPWTGSHGLPGELVFRWRRARIVTFGEAVFMTGDANRGREDAINLLLGLHEFQPANLPTVRGLELHFQEIAQEDRFPQNLKMHVGPFLVDPRLEE